MRAIMAPLCSIQSGTLNGIVFVQEEHANSSIRNNLEVVHRGDRPSR